MLSITSFTGGNHFLSNFYNETVEFEGLTYLNSEAAYQAMKCSDKSKRLDFTNLNPSEAKRLGRDRSISLRKDWESVKEDYMYRIVLAKFTQHEYLKNYLIATGDAYLEEGNTWGDKIWGTVNGKGENKLGKILMRVRRELKEQSVT